MPLILASASPRRRELLARLGVAFAVVPSDVPEVPRPGEEPAQFAQRAAREKAQAVARLNGGLALGADTIVVVDGEILGKPGDAADACRMLGLLSGRSHHVITGVALVDSDGTVREQLSVDTEVEFSRLSPDDIAGYVETGEPLDKAGAYAIQGRAAEFVRRVRGSYSNVVGLPLEEVGDMLRRHDVICGRTSAAEVLRCDIAANVAAVRDRIAAAARRAGRDPADITLVAVSKTKSAEMIEEAISAGVTDIGENYVQEAFAKRSRVRRAVRWHMVGHLQRNKAARAVELFDVIQTVDTRGLAEAVDRFARAGRKTLRVLIEVKLGDEPSKHGVREHEVTALVGSLRDLDGIVVDGLMAIPPAGSPEEARRWFRRLRVLRDATGLRELSMGMTDDFEPAVEEGATMVRVGRAIFGER